MKEATSAGVRYLIKYPEGYKEGETRPLLILLHGAGGRGNDINVLRDNPFYRFTNEQKLPFIVVSPLCTEDTWFDMFERLKEFVKQVSSFSFVDKKRVYLMGASMGGYATWQLAMSMPQSFAAIVPVCGGGMYWNARRIVNMPIWAFHGAKDPTVFVEESQKMVDAVNKRGGNAKLTIYPENAHDAWSDTYSNPEVFSWLLEHEIKEKELGENEYNDQKKFG